MADPYDAGKLLRKKEIEEHNKKLQDGKPWKPKHVGGDTFMNVEQQFGEEGLTFKPKKPPKKIEPQVDHGRPFKPSNPHKKGNTGHETFTSFPEFVAEQQF